MFPAALCVKLLAADVRNAHAEYSRKSCRLSRLTFPDHDRVPVELCKSASAGEITLAVAADLGSPVISVDRRRARAPPAVVSVPEAAVNEQRDPS